MSPQESVSEWLQQLRGGDEAAARKLWERYFKRLVGLARKRLSGTPLGRADAEDVALSVFANLCHGAGQGRFPELVDRDNLWRLLVTITARKAIDLARQEGRQKRGGLAAPDPDGQLDLEQFLDREPGPEFAAQVADECRRLLECLPSDELRSVAQWKMEGYTSEEIAAKLGLVVRSIERKLHVIRSLWSGLAEVRAQSHVG